MNRAKEWLKLIRIPGVFTAHGDIAAGFLIAGGDLAKLPSLIFLLLATSCMFSAGMALNDYFDRHEDLIHRPERPIPSGRIKPGLAFTLGMGLLGLGLVSAHIAGPVPFKISLLLAGAILFYDGFVKGHALMGPLTMGGCRYLNLLLGLSVSPLSPTLALLPLLTWIFISGVTFLSRMEASGGKSLLHLGISFLSILLVTLLYTLFFLTDLLPALPGLAICFGWSLFLLVRLPRLTTVHTPREYRKIVKIMLLSIIVLDSAIAGGTAPLILSFCLWLLLIPAVFSVRLIQIT